MATRRITLRDVAEAAGVSITTVSDVVNGQSRVALETAVQVREVIRRLGYMPRPDRRRGHSVDGKRGHATASRGSQICLLVPDVNPEAAHTDLMENVAVGASQYLAEFRHELIRATLSVDGKLPICIERGQVDGVILRFGLLTDDQRAALAKYPCVTLLGENGRVGDLVAPDDAMMGKAAADYLGACGCRRLICLSPDETHPSFHRRADGCCFHGRACGLDVEYRAVRGGEPLARALDGLKPAPDLGLFVAGNNRANPPAAVAALLRARGLGDRAVAAYVAAEPFTGQLPGFCVSPRRIGRTAGEQLVWRMAHRLADPRQVLIEPIITSPLPNDQTKVAHAL